MLFLVSLASLTFFKHPTIVFASDAQVPDVAEQKNAFFHLAPAGSAECDYGVTTPPADCEDIVAAFFTGDVTGKMDRNIQTGRAGGACGGDDPWSSIPPGCSAQTGGDNTAHYRYDEVEGPCDQFDPAYQLICTNWVPEAETATGQFGMANWPNMFQQGNSNNDQKPQSQTPGLPGLPGLPGMNSKPFDMSNLNPFNWFQQGAPKKEDNEVETGGFPSLDMFNMFQQQPNNNQKPQPQAPGLPGLSGLPGMNSKPFDMSSLSPFGWFQQGAPKKEDNEVETGITPGFYNMFQQQPNNNQKPQSQAPGLPGLPGLPGMNSKPFDMSSLNPFGWFQQGAPKKEERESDVAESGTGWCTDSKPQMCRMMCTYPKCPKGQCATRTNNCCRFSCSDTNINQDAEASLASFGAPRSGTGAPLTFHTTQNSVGSVVKFSFALLGVVGIVYFVFKKKHGDYAEIETRHLDI